MKVLALHCSFPTVLYPPWDNPYGIHGMGGGFQKFQVESMEWGMDSMNWGMDSILFLNGFHEMGDGFHGLGDGLHTFCR